MVNPENGEAWPEQDWDSPDWFPIKGLGKRAAQALNEAIERDNPAKCPLCGLPADNIVFCNEADQTVICPLGKGQNG